MSDERWRHDPFAPPPSALTGVIQPPAAVNELPSDDGLDDLKKAELVALAKERGLDTSGNKPDLIERLRSAG